jgi:hypothetical protein
MLEQKQSDFTEKQIIPAPPPPPPPGYLVKLAPDPGAHEKSKQPVDKPKMSAAEKALIKELETINDPIETEILIIHQCAKAYTIQL